MIPPSKNVEGMSGGTVVEQLFRKQRVIDSNQSPIDSPSLLLLFPTILSIPSLTRAIARLWGHLQSNMHRYPPAFPISLLDRRGGRMVSDLDIDGKNWIRRLEDFTIVLQCRCIMSLHEFTESLTGNPQPYMSQ